MKSTLLTLCLISVFLPQLLLASKVPKEVVKQVYLTYFQQERVLFYIGRHIDTPHVVIWGQDYPQRRYGGYFFKQPERCGRNGKLTTLKG